MATGPNPKQTLVLFSLLFTGKEPKMSDLRPRLSPRERAALVKQGLIELDRRGRAQHVVLTDAAWAWVGANLASPIGDRTPAGETLKTVLACLHAFLTAQGISLAELVRPQPKPNGKPPVRDGQPGLVARVRAAYLRATGGRPDVRVRLADLRAALADVSRAELDQTLLAMEQARTAAFFPLDNPQERFPVDDREALRIAGRPHHVVYLHG
jgi:hypothetical protein